MSPGALFAANALAGAALEEDEAAAVRADKAAGRALEESEVRAVVGLVTGGRAGAGRDAREAVEDESVERRSDDVEAVFA